MFVFDVERTEIDPFAYRFAKGIHIVLELIRRVDSDQDDLHAGQRSNEAKGPFCITPAPPAAECLEFGEGTLYRTEVQRECNRIHEDQALKKGGTDMNLHTFGMKTLQHAASHQTLIEHTDRKLDDIERMVAEYALDLLLIVDRSPQFADQPLLLKFLQGLIDLGPLLSREIFRVMDQKSIHPILA